MAITFETLNPLMFGAMVAASYLAGRWTLRRKRSRLLDANHLFAFWAGLFVVECAITGPLSALSDRSLFWHMVEHFAVLFAGVPLLALSGCVWVCSAILPRQLRSAAARLAKRLRPGARLTVFGAWSFIPVLWGWHLPRLYQLAEDEQLVHALAHASTILTALCFWTVVFGLSRPRASVVARLSLTALAGVAGALFSAVVMFANRPLYGGASGGLADQVAAGVVMCVPASMVYLATAVYLIAADVFAPAARLTRKGGEAAQSM